MLWECVECTARRAVDVETCPECGATEYRDDGAQKMPKISKAAGATDEAQIPRDKHGQPKETEVHPLSLVPPQVLADPTAVKPLVDADGTNPLNYADDEGNRPGVVVSGNLEAYASKDDESDDTDESDDADEGSAYADWTAEALRTELHDRGLSTTGTKPVLVDRLVQSDAERDTTS